MSTFMVYLFCLLVYFGALEVIKFKHRQLTGQLAAVSQSYTNAVMMKEKVRILEEQAALKFAALDCWKMVAENLPEGVTLKALNFSRGRTMNLSGEAEADASQKIVDFSGALGKSTVNGQPITAELPVINNRGTTVAWSINCKLPGRDE